VRYIRRLAQAPALQEYVAEETTPGAGAQTDNEILAIAKRDGSSVFHAAGTCRIGRDELAVLDPGLSVRGVSGLRVADASVMPSLVSGNSNAAAMVIGWRASDLILADA
jgi:choline dehydrogenase